MVQLMLTTQYDVATNEKYTCSHTLIVLKIKWDHFKAELDLCGFC